MTVKKRKLQIVPYTPDNYTPGEVLALNDLTTITSPESIGAALSLYFQWEKKRSSHITFSRATEGKALPCRMDYDRDEASPTEIRIQLQKSKSGLKIVPGTYVLVRFEIFRVSYEFKSIVTATSGNPAREGWHSIIEVPAEIRVIKNRHLPRIKLKPDTRKKLPAAQWESLDGKIKLPLKLLEIGMGSVRASCADAFSEKKGFLRFGITSVPVDVVRSTVGEVILKLNFKDHTDFGPFFDYYRLVAYPSLRSRYEIPFEEGIELYKKSNYFGVSGEKDFKQVEEILNTWEELKSSFHEVTADYYIADEVRGIVGSSSVAFSNFSGTEPLWFFHQLCAMKNPALIEQSGVLYTWRAEYLSSHPTRPAAISNFRSQSRWLERIYVKHSTNSKGGSEVWPTNNKRITFFLSQKESISCLELQSVRFGKVNRVSTKSKDIWGAANPTYLNANEHLDTIIALFKPVSLQEIESISKNILEKLNKECGSFDVLFPHDFQDEAIAKLPTGSDRFTRIPRNDLSLFISSVEHSISVTERKLLNGNKE